MSKKFRIYCRGMGILSLLMLFLEMVGCDPCRELGEKICSCRPTEEEKRHCITDLGLAGQHAYFKNAKIPSVCEEALRKNCTCEEINNNQDERCGMYRLTNE